MTSRTIITFFLTILSLNAQYAVDVSVVDDNDQAVEDAEVLVWFSRLIVGKWDTHKVVGLTDEAGHFIAKGDGQMGMRLVVTKEGFYDYGIKSGKSLEMFTKEPSTIKHTALLRRIKEPIPLYSKVITEATPFRPYKIPVEKKPIGFDFLVSDWVKPHGKGEVADILFCYEKEFVDYDLGNWSLEKLRYENRMKYERQGRHWDEDVFKEEVGIWDSRLEVSFPNKKEGLQQVEGQFNVHSALRMPHLAPEHGYESGYTEKKKTDPWDLARDDMGYFLRTRVKLDEDGEIESANYAKIYGEIEFLPTGYVYFHYYFNPTPNDRNLEFDTKRNLFGDDVEGSRVNLP